MNSFCGLKNLVLIEKVVLTALDLSSRSRCVSHFVRKKALNFVEFIILAIVPSSKL
jgi:hypothetical protein